MTNEKITPEEAGKMIFPFDVAGIRKEMARLLGTPKCGNFVKQLLDLVSRNAQPANKPVAGGDVIRAPQIVPTGRNLHGFDPFRLPSAFAVADGRAQAEAQRDERY